ncbi:acyl--CoA ligase [Candidatus Saccharibacteria bacterium]|nr:acyl--CoA ligase [Candidatus Saccharibacteria bacterium]
MLEFLYRKTKKAIRGLDMLLTRNKYGYIDKLPEDFEYPEGGMYDLIYESCCKWPHSVALTYYNNDITYHELARRIDRTARALKAIGVEKGDRVTVCMPNTPESVYMFYAISEVGAVANMIHPLSSEKEIEEYVSRAESKVILTIDIAYHKVENIIKNTPLEHVIVVSPARSMDFLVTAIYHLTKGRKNHVKKNQVVTTWDRFLSGASKFVGNPHARVNAGDDAVILYSGGTTGKPKGVVLSNLNFNAQAIGAKYLVPELLRSRFSMLCFLPNFHAFGLGVCIHLPLFCGMRAVLIPQFSAKKFKSYIKKYRINILVGVPTVYDYFTKIKFGPSDLKRIKGVVSGGDMVGQALKTRLNDFLRAHGSKGMIHNGYGLTEAAGGMIFSPGTIAERENVIGYPLPDSEVLILDPKTGREVNPGEDGEILLRGLTIMKEYLGDKAETKNAFKEVNGKKYLRTGDIGYTDGSGAVYFRGRLKRMIITNGYNVYPSNVEEVTMKCEAVERCACIGVPDDLRGEIVKIYISVKPNASPRAAKKDLTHIYKKYLAKFETPRLIETIDTFPMTKLGKIDYNQLVEMSKKRKRR